MDDGHAHDTITDTMPEIQLINKKNKYKQFMIMVDAIGLFIVLFFTWTMIIKFIFFNEFNYYFDGLCLIMTIVIGYVGLLFMTG